jgi:hypothetical protein
MVVNKSSNTASSPSPIKFLAAKAIFTGSMVVHGLARYWDKIDQERKLFSSKEDVEDSKESRKKLGWAGSLPMVGFSTGMFIGLSKGSSAAMLGYGMAGAVALPVAFAAFAYGCYQVASRFSSVPQTDKEVMLIAKEFCRRLLRRSSAITTTAQVVSTSEVRALPPSKWQPFDWKNRSRD